MIRKSGLVLVCFAGLAVAGAMAAGGGGVASKPDSSHAGASKSGATKPARKPAKGDHKSDHKTDSKHNDDAHAGASADAHGAANHAAPARNASPITGAAPIDPDEALLLLQEGNQRWVSNQGIHPNVDAERRQQTADNGQTPFVTILTCADSRIPVEHVFDRGVGELFVIRVAGNTANLSETGTIEYGLGHLNTRLLVVMGHTKCGAVAAAATNAKLHGKVAELVQGIQPAVERARRQNPGIDDKQLTSLAIKENVWQSCSTLITTSPEIRDLVTEGKVKVVGAVYDISSGKVEFLGEHPWQRELLGAAGAKPAQAQVQEAHAEEGH
jgi:carbonic anhydrase